MSTSSQPAAETLPPAILLAIAALEQEAVTFGADPTEDNARRCASVRQNLSDAIRRQLDAARGVNAL